MLHNEVDVKFIQLDRHRRAGQVTRMAESDPAKKVLRTKLGGNVDRRDGLKLRWCEKLRGGCCTCWVQKSEINAQPREKWWKLIEDLKSLPQM
jgi:hypothetical protein